MNKKIFSTLLLVVCLAVMTSAAFGQQQQRRRMRSGGLDNLSLPSTGTAIAYTSWQRVAPAGAGFSVMMPGYPDEMSRDMTREQNAVGLREYRVKAGDAEYIVGVVLNLPVELTQQTDFADRYLQLLPMGLMKSAQHASKNYKLTSQRSISINDHPGRQYKFDAPDYTCTLRAYLTGQRVYIIAVESPKAAVAVEGAEKFFSSFTLEEN